MAFWGDHRDSQWREGEQGGKAGRVGCKFLEPSLRAVLLLPLGAREGLGDALRGLPLSCLHTPGAVCGGDLA